MYHVGTTKRSHDSAELIFYGVAICSQEKPLDSVTVSDIQRTTGVARTTFYRSFDTILDVLEWKCDQYYREFLSHCPARLSDSFSVSRITKYALSYINDNPDLPLYLIGQNRIDMLFERYRDLTDDLDPDISGLSPYSIFLCWSVPILLLMCKSRNQLTDTPDEIWAQLIQDGIIKHSDI